MKNRVLEREKDTISYIIDDLAQEIEELENKLSDYEQTITILEDRIEQLKNNNK